MRVIGLISGTSMDAIDVAVAELSLDGPTVHLEPVEHAGHPFPEHLREQPNSAADLCALDIGIGRAFGEVAARYRGDLVASLGQTAHHEVEGGRCLGTLQLGRPAWIAEATGLPVISDFRSRDVAAGGHGAPLASTLDALWLADFDGPATALNLGGIANVTKVSPEGVIAFDTGPGNALLDAAMTVLTGGRRTQDTDGEFARRGRVDAELLDRLLADPYYALPAPKSTGKEHFNRAYLDRVADGMTVQAEDFLATLTELTARTAAAGCEGVVIGSGGGMRNPALVESLRRHVDLRPSDEFGLPADGKEAYLAALLGFLTWHGLPANVPSATGAAGPRPLGSITPGRFPPRLPEPAVTAVRGLRIGRRPRPWDGGPRART
ncbi:anhydro-N-acetylmuramic acid kinase [Saccharothrix xinjiangensis]|uniref:Anhydro-N-acetylmuramic acid kinase n=1 Tax=Saccharothrix xinjiangensis TaxID=204798 RepID=A0ABV9XQP2_9PSEU